MHKGFGSRKPHRIVPNVLRVGDLGRRPAPARRSPAESDPVRTAAERNAWQQRYGVDWVEGIRELAGWAAEAGIPIRAGSRALATSPLVLGWGWGGLPESIGRSQPADWTPVSAGAAKPGWERPSRPTWILRTAPGWGDALRNRVERDPRLDARGAAPCLVVEETPRAYLPPQPYATAWPGREAWARSARLLGVGGEAPFVPEDWDHLVGELREGSRGRHPLESEQAWLTAWDLWCAACAWERDRAAWWITRHAAGFVGPEEEVRWMRRAADWGVRVLPPGVESSRVCARHEGRDVRLGLEELSARVRDVAPELVRERVRGGSYGSVGELVRRSSRRGAGAAVIAELAATGALGELRGSLALTVAQTVRTWWRDARRSVAPVPSRAAFSGGRF